MNTTIALRDYLGKGKVFIIPNYQRGYVWGKARVNETDSVTYLMKTIKQAFNSDSDVFLQGVTVSESNDKIIIIDGQQRTTCLFLLLKYLGYNEKFEIKYEIRGESSEYLKNIGCEESEQGDEEFQDIYFFKKSMRIIRETFPSCNQGELLTSLLDRIKFLYVNIPDTSQAVKVFTMMNGNRAQMQTEEIIKAELLRVASQGDNNYRLEREKDYSYEWDNNMIRSRYAREWDKWLHWWNRMEVQKLFRCNNVMGLLIKTFYKDHEKELSFESFKRIYLNENSTQQAKAVFDKLRRLQKRFEDAFDEPVLYNQIGAILRISNAADSFIQSYFNDDKHVFNLEAYYKCVFMGMTHKEIMDYVEDKKKNICNEKFNEKFAITLNAIDDDFAYLNNKEAVFRLLLRLNIDQDCKQNQYNDIRGRKFDFSIWDCGVRSLEHIQSQSKVRHEKDGALFNGKGESLQPIGKDPTYIHRDEIFFKDDKLAISVSTSEHSIGNLVLLYKNENSSFGAGTFEEKKAKFFDPKEKEFFNSRHLLHTIYTFSKSKWDGEAIAENKYTIIERFKEYYGKQD